MINSRKDMTNEPYNPAWPAQFEELRNTLSQALGDRIIAIEHVGSTAIPGMPAKPKLDIDIVISSMALLPTIAERLEPLGYISQGNLGREGREAFGRKDDQVPYTHHMKSWPKHNLYVCPQDSPVLQEHLRFRDYLRQHPDLAEQYARLKQELSERYRYDQQQYVAGKSDFVRQILALSAENSNTMRG